MDVTRPDRRIVTFYSYKGGVGRTMALANVAFRLADRNDLDVIAVDWDLEAPGLHRFFGISDEVAATKGGLLEYLLAWREAYEDDADAPPDATGWLIPVTDPEHKPANGSLSLLLAGRLDEGYSDRLRGFDWLPFYRFNAGASAIETLRRQLAGRADMVLVDSRTGVTDAGGICTVQMPDGVVLMTGANEQSFAGIERVGRAIVKGDRDRPGRGQPKVWVAVGRVPESGEDWFDHYGPRFEAGYKAGLWAKSDHPRGLRSYRLPHVSRWGFGEHIVDMRPENDDPLAMAYGVLGDELVGWARGKEKQDHTQDRGGKRTMQELQLGVEQAEQRGDLARLSGALFELAGTLSDAGDLTSAAEMLQKAAGIALARGQRPDYAAALVRLGQVRRDQERFDEAEVSFKRAIEADPKYDAVLGYYAFFLWDARKDHDKAEEFYKRAIEAEPRQAITLGGYALFLSRIRKDHNKSEEFHKRAIEADPKHANNLGNYAGLLLAISRQTEGLAMLDRALDAPDPSSAQRAECWFYALAHRPPEQRGAAHAHLKRLVTVDGARSPGWDLSGNVERARSEGHPDAAWLALLADVISEKAEPSVLEAWPAWAAA
jgi:tetratricopeptide (TPR) repeat protein/CO dehydrogenase nickel-insertion accessory protein CooC1